MGPAGPTLLVRWFFTNPSEKYARVKLGSSSLILGVKIPKIFELPPPRLVHKRVVNYVNFVKVNQDLFYRN